MNNLSEFGISEENLSTLTPEEELLVERLVDGELSELERQEILLRLDERVDGWRYCALSFLEAQAFRAALKNGFPCEAMTEKGVVAASAYSGAAASANVSRRTWHVSAVSAAAGFLVAAVSMGTFLHPSTRPDGDASSLASLSTRTDEAKPTLDFSASSDIARDQNSLDAPQNGAQSLFSDSVTPRTVVLNSPSLGLSGITTTCSEADVYDPHSFHNVNAVPQEVVNHMHNVGGSIDAHRDEYRFPLDNNRVLILPVDTYNVKTDGNQYIW